MASAGMTIEQKQCLLKYLGFYTGNVDGKWGRLSIEATEAFQNAWGLGVDGIFGPMTQARILEVISSGAAAKPAEDTAGEDWWNGIRYFTREEFRCKCGGTFCSGFPAEPKETLVRLSDQVRGHFGSPVTVSSGVRCEAHNAAVGGVANSRHLSGRAVDFCVSGFSAASVLSWVQKQPQVRYAYAINDTYVHMDVE